MGPALVEAGPRAGASSSRPPQEPLVRSAGSSQHAPPCRCCSCRLGQACAVGHGERSAARARRERGMSPSTGNNGMLLAVCISRDSIDRIHRHGGWDGRDRITVGQWLAVSDQQRPPASEALSDAASWNETLTCDDADPAHHEAVIRLRCCTHSSGLTRPIPLPNAPSHPQQAFARTAPRRAAAAGSSSLRRSARKQQPQQHPHTHTPRPPRLAAACAFACCRGHPRRED